MLYKQSRILKSKCSVDSVARAGGGGGWRRLGAGEPPPWATPVWARGPRQSDHPAGVSAKARGRMGQGRSLRLPGCFFPWDRGEEAALRDGSGRPPSPSLGAKHRTGSGSVCPKTCRRSEPGVAHPLSLLSCPGWKTLQPPPSATPLSLTVKERRFPAGRGTSGSGTDWFPAWGSSGSSPRSPPATVPAARPAAFSRRRRQSRGSPKPRTRR